MLNRIVESIEKLSDWLKHNGWAGYDPYDILEYLHKRYPNRINFCKKIQRWAIIELESFFPLKTRIFLNIKKEINAKAMGLFTSSYVRLYMATKKKEYLDKAKDCLKWLDSNYSKGYSGKCWGYPFDWQSMIFIPKGTPSSVVSSIVGDGYWKFYQLTKDKKHLSDCESICEFFINNLNIDKIDNNRVCFSYTPIDDFHVHNANLFVAEFLLKVGTELSNNNYIELGLNALNYTLSEQNDDGSLFYWGRIQDHYNPKSLDHYHCGFEIRSLYSICNITGEDKFYQAAKKYYLFYLANFFEDKTIPKLTPKKKYPINIHSCAEAILCNSILSNDFLEGEKYLKSTLTWTLDNMQDKEGWFYYMIRKRKGIEMKVKIPYIRWGQAWMLRGLSEVNHLCQF